MESDSDYEEASEDPFEGQFSDSDDSSDDSSDEIEIDNRDCTFANSNYCLRIVQIPLLTTSLSSLHL